MRNALANLFLKTGFWLRGKRAPSAAAGNQWTGSSTLDAFGKNREPTLNELIQELKGCAWTCASINSAACATFPPRLYVTTQPSHPKPKCPTRPLAPEVEKHLRTHPRLRAKTQSAAKLEEVTEHPLLDLLHQANPIHNAFDLWELTQFYMEVIGAAYWYLEPGPFGVPLRLWPIPAQNIRPKRDPNSTSIIDYYEYIAGTNRQRFKPEEIIHFRFPDPRNPYTGGLSPLRAAFENVALTSNFLAFKEAKFQNHAIPDAVVSPKEVIGEEERDRLETQWNQQFRRAGAGKLLVAESEMSVQILNHSMGDLAALADMKASKEDICNAFHVPIAFLTTQTNLANLTASQIQHMTQAISPRLERRDEKLNQQLVPLFDPSGRLFVASEDPIPVDADQAIAQKEMDLKYGVVTINEVRSERGLPPVPWGNVPWLPERWCPTDVPRRFAGTGDAPPDASSDYGQDASGQDPAVDAA